MRPRRLLLFVAVTLALTSPARSVFARDCRVGLLPNGSKFQCLTCHTTQRGGGSRNAFGLDVQKAINNSGSCNAVVWSAAVAKLDSDLDGIPNGQELLDPEGAWRSGSPSPGPLKDVTNPGVKDAPKPAKFLRADFDASGVLSVADAVNTITYLFDGGKAPGCIAAADANSDGKVDVSDVVFTLEYLFRRGSPPPSPFPNCGETPVSASCQTAASCV